MKTRQEMIIRRIGRWFFVALASIMPLFLSLSSNNSISQSSRQTLQNVHWLVVFVTFVSFLVIRDVLYSGRVIPWTNAQPLIILLSIGCLIYSTLFHGLFSCGNDRHEPNNYGVLLLMLYVITGVSGFTSLAVEVWLGSKE